MPYFYPHLSLSFGQMVLRRRVERMRVFLGIELSGELRERIGSLQDELRPRLHAARWVPAANLHLTLRFVGETSPERADFLRANLRAPIRREAAFGLALLGLGCFPRVEKPQVLFIAVAPVEDTLLVLHRSVERVIQSGGFEADARRFHPHLTIARFKQREPALHKTLPGYSEHAWGSMSVSEVILFESRLSGSGARYHVLERFGLGGTNRNQAVQ